MRAVSTVLLALLSVVGVASAQTAQTLPRGTRVRITPAPPARMVVGRLIAVTDSAFVVRRDRGDLTIPRSAIQRFEVSRGTSRGRSAGWGAYVGLVIGGVAGYAAGADHCSDSWWCLKRPGAALLGATTGAATGSLIGLGVGSFERWRDEAFPMSLSVVPMGRKSVSVTSRIAF